MVTDLNGFWKLKSDNEIFQIEQKGEEDFKVIEPDSNKEYKFHLSLGSDNDGHITSSIPFWNEKLIFFKSEDLFVLRGQFQNQSWYFERTEELE